MIESSSNPTELSDFKFEIRSKQSPIEKQLFSIEVPTEWYGPLQSTETYRPSLIDVGVEAPRQIPCELRHHAGKWELVWFQSAMPAQSVKRLCASLKPSETRIVKSLSINRTPLGWLFRRRKRFLASVELMPTGIELLVPSPAIVVGFPIASSGSYSARVNMSAATPGSLASRLTVAVDHSKGESPPLFREQFDIMVTSMGRDQLSIDIVRELQASTGPIRLGEGLPDSILPAVTILPRSPSAGVGQFFPGIDISNDLVGICSAGVIGPAGELLWLWITHEQDPGCSPCWSVEKGLHLAKPRLSGTSLHLGESLVWHYRLQVGSYRHGLEECRRQLLRVQTLPSITVQEQETKEGSAG